MPSLTTINPNDVIANSRSDLNNNFTAINNAVIQKTFVTVGTSTGADYVCTGTADNIQIQAAINAVNTVGGGIILIKAGTYNLANPLTLTGKSKIEIIGENRATVFQIPQASLANFGFSYMLSSDTTGIDIKVKGIYFKGGYSTYTSPPANQGGGVAPGTRWIIEDCTFVDFNYFGLWLGTNGSDVKILRNRFLGPGNGVDHIGGGGSTRVEIASNTWESNCVGNAWDNVGGTYFNIHDNINLSPNSFYIEAMQYIDVHHNTFVGAGNIISQSNSGYSPASITNSRYIKIKNNNLYGGGSIVSTTATDPVKTSTVGGNIKIQGNYIDTPATYGILVHGGGDDNTRWGNGYSIANNIIKNANNTNVTTTNTGYAVVNPSAINVAQGFDVLIADNICIDTRVTPQQRYGIQVGQTFSASANNEANHVTVGVNQIRGYVTGKVNTVSPTYTTDIIIY